MQELKDIVAIVNIVQGGAKRALFNRIAMLGSGVVQVDENKFKYSHPAVEDGRCQGGDKATTMG